MNRHERRREAKRRLVDLSPGARDLLVRMVTWWVDAPDEGGALLPEHMPRQDRIEATLWAIENGLAQVVGVGPAPADGTLGRITILPTQKGAAMWAQETGEQVPPWFLMGGQP